MTEQVHEVTELPKPRKWFTRKNAEKGATAIIIAGVLLLAADKVNDLRNRNSDAEDAEQD